MNLENFPTSPTAKRFLTMVTTGFYEKSYVGKWIYQVIGTEFDAVLSIIEELPDQGIIETATWGLRYWEELVGLPINESDTLENRRKKVRDKLNNRHPVNPEYIRKIVEQVTDTTCKITENVADYTFRVELDTTGKTIDYEALTKKLDSVKPSHLSYKYSSTEETGGGGFYIGNAVREIIMLKDSNTEVEADPLASVSYLTENNQILMHNETILFIKGGSL